MGYGLPEIMDIFEQEDIAFPSDPVFRRFAVLVSEAQRNSRTMLFRGNRSEECPGLYSEMDQGAQKEILIDQLCGAGREPAGSAKKIYPNDPCPCGSGKKYKK